MSDTHSVKVVVPGSSPVLSASVRHARVHAHRDIKSKSLKSEQLSRDEAWERRMKQLNPIWTPYRDSLADVS